MKALLTNPVVRALLVTVVVAALGAAAASSDLAAEILKGVCK